MYTFESPLDEMSSVEPTFLMGKREEGCTVRATVITSDLPVVRRI